MGYKKIVVSGELVETYEYERNLPKRKKGTYRKVRSKKKEIDGKYLALQTRSQSNLFRSKKAFTRIIRANLTRADFPAFLTLTCYQTFDVVDAWTFLSPFWQLIKRQFGEVAYIVVPEFQKKGRVHFHALVWGIPNDVITNERNTRVLQRFWGRGFLDIRSAYDRSPRIANYMGKYMFKAMSDSRLFGKRAYSVSRNIMRPVSYPFNSAFAFLEHFVKDPVKSCIDVREYDTYYLGKAVYKRYNKI